MKIDLDDKTDVLTYHKKLLAEAEKEKEDLKAKVEKWHNSSKNLGKLLNTQMSANDKFGLGYGDYRYDGILSYENEVLQSVFMNKESDLENQPLYDRSDTTEGMHVVPPPMTGNYMPSGPDIEIDYSQFTYGPKQSQPSESKTQTSDFDTCESNISVETSEFVTETVVNESNIVSQPKVWSDAPIIEEYEETVKNQFIHSKNPKVDKKGLGYGFTTKACFVCGSLSHLIRDCYFHEKRMAKQAELNTRMSKKSSQKEIRPISNNVQRVNHKNQFVPTTVLTRTGKIPVNTARVSGTNNVSTATHNFNSQATNVARKISTVKPVVNRTKKTDEKPIDKEDQVFLDELERLKRQEHDANDAAKALRKEFTQETEDLLLQAGAAKTSSTNIVNTASTPVSTASPYGGLSFTDLTNPDQDDSEIPTLEDIDKNPTDGIFTNSSYGDEGAVADFINLEPVVNVSPIPTSRINSIHPSTLILGDPQSAVTKSFGAHAF
ncbi:hypothetical protein Tco_0264851, partial [Tanacetum coccineum]